MFARQDRLVHHSQVSHRKRFTRYDRFPHYGWPTPAALDWDVRKRLHRNACVPPVHLLATGADAPALDCRSVSTVGLVMFSTPEAHRASALVDLTDDERSAGLRWYHDQRPIIVQRGVLRMKQ